MTRYLEQINECTDPTTGDFLPIYDASAGASDKDRKVNISRFAILANAQSFTTTQTFAPSSSSAKALIVNAASGASVVAQEWQLATVQRAYVNLTSSISQFGLSSYDNTTGVGPSLIAGRNSNASTPAAGNVRLTNRGSTDYYIWPDASANLRIGSSVPTSANDTSGTVVGTQTSALASKNVIGEFTDYGAALQAIVDAPLYDFTYKSGSFNGEQFTGIITDYSPTFGMDGGKSLNEITAHGYSMAAIKALHGKIEALETQVAELQTR